MLTAITGRPGEGKSCFAVRRIIYEALLRTERVVCTNLIIDRDELKRQLEADGGSYSDDQLRILPDPFEDETYNPHRFWEWCPKGSIVVIDEAGEYLNSYDFVGGLQSGAKEVGVYGRLHRHLDQDCFLITQDLSHIAKQLRDLIAEHVRVFNLKQHPPLGIKLPFFIMRQFTLGGTANAKAHTFKIYRHRARDFALYDSKQHQNFLQTVDGEGQVDKEKVGKDKWYQKITKFAFGSPIMLLCGVCLLILCLVLAGVWGTVDGLTEPADMFSPNETKTTASSLPVPALRDGPRRGREKRRHSTRSRATKTYTGNRVRSYGLRTDSTGSSGISSRLGSGR